MGAPLGDLSPERFLRDHWQRSPCLIRGAFPGFQSPLEGDDLAGLACEPVSEARIVTGPDAAGAWSLRHGPFDAADFDALGERNWTLLVQDVEKHYPPLGEWLRAFDFVPAWRRDDLMVSFAAPGGSVGAHVDQYDVFLLQAEGRREWSIARAFDDERREDAPLDMLARFEAEERWVLEPGDMLYLPPGVAHHGVALDPCLTYSIGFRAPSAADLAMALGEWLARDPAEGGRYTDPPLSPGKPAGLVDDDALGRFRALLHAVLDDGSAFGEFIAAFLSRYRQAHEPATEPGAAAWAPARRLENGGSVSLHPWARACWIARDNGALLTVSGLALDCSRGLAAWICAGAQGAPPALEARDRACLQRLADTGRLLPLDDEKR